MFETNPICFDLCFDSTMRHIVLHSINTYIYIHLVYDSFIYYSICFYVIHWYSMFLLVHDSSWLLPQSQPSCVSGFGLACDLGRFLETWAILWGFIEVQSSQELNLWISMESNMFRVSEVMEKWKNGEKHPQLSSMDDGFSMEINHINTIGVPPNSFIHFLDHFWDQKKLGIPPLEINILDDKTWINPKHFEQRVFQRWFDDSQLKTIFSRVNHNRAG